MKHISFYGDESINNNIACYAVCGLATELVATLEEIIKSIKKEFGIDDKIILHCKSLFHGSGREKITPHLKREDIKNMYLKIANKVKTCIFMCSFFDKRFAPSQQFLAYNNKITKAYYGDSELNHICKNCCMIYMVDNMKAEEYAFYPEPDLSSRIRWCGKNKAKAMHDGNNMIISPKYFRDKNDKRFIKLQHSELKKLPIHQVADFVAYSFAKAKTIQSDQNKEFFIKIMKILNPRIRENIFNCGDTGEDWLLKTEPFKYHKWD